MRVVLAIAFIAAMDAPSFAQQPDPSFLSRALNAVAAQRNSSQNAEAVCSANAAKTTDDLANARAKIKELEAQIAAKDVPATSNEKQ